MPVDARTSKALKSLLNALRSAKKQHRLEDVGIVLEALAEFHDVRVFALLYPKLNTTEYND
jgi:hypothetical protein